MTYSIRTNPDNTVTAILDNGGTEIGSYVNEAELERDMEQIAEHLEAGAWCGKPK